MRADAYKLADLEAFTTRYPASEVGRYINQGISELWDLLIASRGYSYFGKPWYATPSITSTGTTPPTVTITGVPRVGTSTSNFIIDVVTGGTLGTMTFRVSNDNGSTYGSTITSATAGVHWLSDLALMVTFASGTYNANNTYTGSTYAKPTTTSGQLAYALPTDFYKLHRLFVTDSSDSLIELDMVTSEDEPSLRESDTAKPRYCQIRDGFFDLMPRPDGTYTINMLYVPTAPILVADSDTFDGWNGYEEYPVCYAAHEMLLKEGDIELANMVMQKMNKMAQRISRAAADRDHGTPMRVQDVRGALSWKSRLRNRYYR